MFLWAITDLQGAGEAHEEQQVDGEQVEEEEMSRAGPARQQARKVEAPPPDPAATRHHASFHLSCYEGLVRVQTQSFPLLLCFHLDVEIPRTGAHTLGSVLSES